MTGRPRLYGRNSNQFLHYYLDPLRTPASICQLCNISKTTFYVYEKELQLPQLRVGIENYHTHVPRQKALQMFSTPGELRELHVLREIAKRIQARITLIPYNAGDAFAALNATAKKEVDFSVASIAWTKERSRTLYFSEAYDPTYQPGGCLMRLKSRALARPSSTELPRLGVYEHSVHFDYAVKNLQHEFRLVTYKNVEPLFKALRAGKVQFVLLHPVWLEIFPRIAPEIEIVSEKITYQSHTGVVFHSDSEHWRKPINLAIEQMLSEASGQ